MATKKKLLQAAAGSAGGAGLNVEDVFSTYLYTGTNSSHKVTNNLDLSTEGGLLWAKSRSSSGTLTHYLMDSERGLNKHLSTNLTSAQVTRTDMVSSFDTDGYTLSTNIRINSTSYTYVNWTFRKAPKFFDVVTYTGDGVQGRSISHNLGSVPAVIITKKLNASENWVVYHRSNGAGKMLYLNGTNSTLNSTAVYPTTPTDSVFYVGNDSAVNGTSSDTYVAYLFAHNDGDGGFGPNGDQDIIKCGSYTGTGAAGLEIDLGFEPQWFLMKRTDTAGSDWFLFDVMRGFDASGNADRGLRVNTSEAESNVGPAFRPIANGVELQGTFSSVNASGGNYIYIAIRRGPMAVPENATDVFAVNNGDGSSSNPGLISGFPVDFGWQKFTTLGSDNHIAWSRLTQGKSLALNTTAAEISAVQAYFDYMNGMGTSAYSTNLYSWMWRRAPKYFDVVAYTGDGTSNRAVEHNLGVAPEMIWVKARNISYDWVVKHKDLGRDELTLNATTAAGGNLGADFWGAGTDTSTVFHTANSGTNRNTNGNNDTYIAYLFASLAGVSKVGSYTGNGSSQTIDCGFSAGARFILIKRTDSTGDWYVWDTERGIVAANDPHLSLNTTAAEVTTDDSIDPDNSGFIVNQVSATNINVSSASYIFYAVS